MLITNSQSFVDIKHLPLTKGFIRTGCRGGERLPFQSLRLVFIQTSVSQECSALPQYLEKLERLEKNEENGNRFIFGMSRQLEARRPNNALELIPLYKNALKSSSLTTREKQCMSTPQIDDADALLQRITIDPQLCHGKPCIRGLRYPVEMLLELLSAGMTVEEILADYEDLEHADILAALAFATRLTQVKRLQPLAV